MMFYISKIEDCWRVSGESGFFDNKFISREEAYKFIERKMNEPPRGKRKEY